MSAASRMTGQGDTQVLERHGLAFTRGGERDGPLPGAVRHEHVGGAGLGQRLDRAFGHLTGTDHEHGATLDPADAVTGQRDRSLRDRGDASGDRGLGTSPLAGLDRVAEEPTECRPDGALGPGDFPGITNLTEDLVFADHRGVESGGHGEEVTHRFCVVVGVQVIGDVLWREAGLTSQKLANVLVATMEPFGEGVDLDAVAGGQHDDLGEVIGFTET